MLQADENGRGAHTRQAPKGDLYIVGGIKGLQAYSTQVVTEALVEQLTALGWRCHVLSMTPRWVPSTTALRWAAEATYRYLLYPLWCRSKVHRHDLVYVTDHANAGVLLALPRSVRSLVHVHDMTSIRPPWDFPYRLRARNLAIWALGSRSKKRGIRKADRLIAISDFTSSEVEKYVGVDRAKMTVVGNGIDHDTYAPIPRAEARAECALPGDDFIVMTVGPSSYRKNLEVLAKALGQRRGELGAFSWVHVGAVDGRSLEILREHGIQDRLRIVTGVSNQKMRAFYCAATVFVHPSLYEGFGLPPVEAMSCGTPVISSDIPSAREVLGDSASFFPARDAAALAELLVLAQRGGLEPRDPSVLIEHAARYQWRTAASSIDEVISRLPSAIRDL